MAKKEIPSTYEAPAGLTGDAKTKKKKTTFLKMLDLHLGIVSPACRAANIGRTIAYKWRKQDAVFAEAWEDIEESQIDLVETTLLKNIRNGKEASTIFYLKSKAKDRGYDETQQAPTQKIKVTIKKGDT